MNMKNCYVRNDEPSKKKILMAQAKVRFFFGHPGFRNAQWTHKTALSSIDEAKAVSLYFPKTHNEHIVQTNANYR